MENDRAKRIISKHLARISDKGFEQILRAVLFDPNSPISWDKVGYSIEDYMPEYTVPSVNLDVD